MLPACAGAPGPNVAALERAMLRGAEDKSGWSGMVIKCNRVRVGAVAPRQEAANVGVT